MAEEDSPGLSLYCGVRVGERIGGRDCEGGHEVRVKERQRGAIFQDGENSVGDLVNGEVYADILLGSFPHDGAFGGVKLNQEGAVTLGGPGGRLVGN